jgi:[ribosomal protein S5]-alanine N-acetyltransferase
MTEFPLLETPRLVLREIVPADAPAILSMYRDARHMRWLGADPVSNLAEAALLIKAYAGWRAQTNPGVRWGLELRGVSGLIGTCGLYRWRPDYRCCSLVYELAPGHVGAGLMLEAVQAAIGWGHAHMRLNRIEALVHIDNAPSVRLLEKLAFAREGLLREAGFWGGCYHNLYQYSLLRADWRIIQVPDRPAEEAVLPT